MLFETLRLVCCAFSFQCGACEADDRLGLPAKEPQSLWEARLCATLALTTGRRSPVAREETRTAKAAVRATCPRPHGRPPPRISYLEARHAGRVGKEARKRRRPTACNALIIIYLITGQQLESMR